MKNKMLYVALILVGLQTVSINAHAEVVGVSVIGVTMSEVTEIATGWRVKKSILGIPVYNEMGAKIGSVDDLIIAPNKSLSYAIIGAGGFLGMDQYDVAIPITQINEINGKMVLKSATKESIKQMPKFEYAPTSATRDPFIANAEKDTHKGKDQLAELNKKAMSEKSELKAKVDAEVLELQQQIKNADAKLIELKNASKKMA